MGVKVGTLFLLFVEGMYSSLPPPFLLKESRIKGFRPSLMTESTLEEYRVDVQHKEHLEAVRRYWKVANGFVRTPAGLLR